MKILYLSHRIPFPPNKGDKIRSYNEVKYLAQRHDLDLICLADEAGDLQYRSDLEKVCSRVAVFPLNKTVGKIRGLATLALGKSISVGYFYQKEVQALFDQWMQERDYDTLVCFSSSMAEYVFNSPYLNRRPSPVGKKPRLIMDFCDVDSDKWLQYAADARFPLSWLFRMENRRLAAYEGKISRIFDHSVLISQSETELFAKVCPEATRLKLVPNGVDFDYFQPAQPAPAASDPVLVFTGAMDYHANVDGVCWFCREIFPALKKAHPGLRFYIVGSNPTGAVRELGRLDGVEVTGFVQDVRDYYRLADVCVIPLRLARGVQNKVLESMSMGKALVTTSKANAGIQARDGEHLLVADTAAHFAEKVLALLSDGETRSRMGKKARDFVVCHYDWPTNMEKLEKLMEC